MRPAGYDALPARFKTYVMGLEREVERLRGMLDVEGETLVRLESYGGGRDTHRNLPDESRIVFSCTGPDKRPRRIEVQLDRRRGSNGVSVSSPDGRLAVLPEVSNEFCVRVGEY